MIMARVIGNVWATRKEENLRGIKLLIVQPINSKHDKVREELVVADRIGAGVGDHVLVTSGGSARYILTNVPLPIDAVVVGIIDSTEVRGDSDE